MSFYQSHSLSMNMLPGLSCWCGSNIEFTLHVEIWDNLLALHSVLHRGGYAKATILILCIQLHFEKHAQCQNCVKIYNTLIYPQTYLASYQSITQKQVLWDLVFLISVLILSYHQSSCSRTLISTDHLDVKVSVKNRIRSVMTILQWELTAGTEQLQSRIHQ